MTGLEAARVSVLIPTFRQPETLLLTLRDLTRQTYPADRVELVVIDDGSGDTSDLVSVSSRPAGMSLTLRVRPSRGGAYSHAALFNELLRLCAPASQVFIHVEDARVPETFLAAHVRWHRDQQVRLVTGPMCEGHEEIFDAQACARWPLMTMSGRLAEAYTCCFRSVFAKSMSYSRTLLERLDSPTFDEAMSGWGYHETEFALRAAQAGAECVYDTRCAVYHPPHRPRDERTHRGLDRQVEQSLGERQNVEYLLEKHHLRGLPDWEPGRPLEDVPAIDV